MIDEDDDDRRELYADLGRMARRTTIDARDIPTCPICRLATCADRLACNALMLRALTRPDERGEREVRR